MDADKWYANHPIIKEIVVTAPSDVAEVKPKTSGPQKGSKRHFSIEDSPDYRVWMQGYSYGLEVGRNNPAQPISEKEPAPKRKCADGQILYAVPCGPQPDLNQPIQPWDCGDGKPTTAPCPAASQTAEKP